MKLKYNEEKNKDLDQGWAWVIMIAASLAGLLNGLLIYAAGVIHVAPLEKHEQDNAYTSLIGSLFTSLLSLVGGLFLLAALLTLIGSNWRASTENSDNMRCPSKDLNGIVSQCSLNVSTERSQNVLLHDRNITIEVILDQQSRLIEENDNFAEAFDTSHEQESVNEFTPMTYKENGALYSEMGVINKLFGSRKTVKNSERNKYHVLTEDYLFLSEFFTVFSELLLIL